ncbi:MAG: sel1 repeat family protein [Pseudomonas sp.]|nr:sel1 repeat family protein [Pseudomonas sp.]
MPAWADLKPEQQAAKERGSTLYHQFKAISAEPYLTIAAEAGDSESQFLLAEALRKNNRYMTKEAYHWLEKAAGQGNTYAMIRLGRRDEGLCSVMANCPDGSKTPEQWLAEARRLNEPKAAQGDAEAMYLMYQITFDIDWIEKAAKAGHSLAQYWLAVAIEQGRGFYWWPGSRQEEVEKWYKASAEGGYPLSMQDYALLLLSKDDYTGYQYWTERAAETGYANAVFNLGLGISLMADDYGYEQDLVKGYGVLSLLLELDGGGGMADKAARNQERLQDQMTAEQLEQAREFAAEWKATHPPLSFFKQKLHPSDTLF